jgi:hypothetical protein
MGVHVEVQPQIKLTLTLTLTQTGLLIEDAEAQRNQSSETLRCVRSRTDLAQARKIADRKGIGYQTPLKMLVREGLLREARRG